MYFLHWFSMDSVNGFISVGFKFILVPSSGVEPFLSALPALSFFLFRSLSLRFVFAFYTCSKGVLKRIKTSFPEKHSLEYYPERVEIFSGTALELGIRSRTFTFAGTKGINRSGSDTELLAKSRQRRAVKQYIALAIPPVGRATGRVGRCVNAFATSERLPSVFLPLNPKNPHSIIK